MESMNMLRDLLYCELEELTKGGTISHGSLDSIGAILDAIKDIETINMYADGNSRDSYGGTSNEYSGRYARDNYGRSYEGNSYARRRNRMGQFSRTGYSGHDEEIIMKLEQMMDSVGEEDRRTIEKAISMMEK